jgi:hypothetical protein
MRQKQPKKVDNDYRYLSDRQNRQAQKQVMHIGWSSDRQAEKPPN